MHSMNAHTARTFAEGLITLFLETLMGFFKLFFLFSALQVLSRNGFNNPSKT